MTLRERVARRLRQYHCKACGTYFTRTLPNCPACKTLKGLRGDRPVGFGAGIG